MPELLNCAVCGGRVSSDAKNCPHCGSPNYKTQQQLQKEQKQLRDTYESNMLIEKDRQLRRVDFTYAYCGKIVPICKVYIYFTGRGYYGGIVGSAHYFWLDGQIIYSGKAYDLACGSHTIGIGLGVFGYPECDVTKEFTVLENTRRIEVKYKFPAGFFSKAAVKILSVDVQ